MAKRRRKAKARTARKTRRKARRSAPAVRRRRRRVARSSRPVTRARRSRRRGAPRSAPMARRKSSRRRRSGGSFAMGSRGGFVNTNLLIQGGIAAGSALATSFVFGKLAPKLPAGIADSPTGSIIAKVVIALGMAFVAKKYAPKYANAIGIGAAASAMTDVIALARSKVNAPAAAVARLPVAGARTGVAGLGINDYLGSYQDGPSRWMQAPDGSVVVFNG